MLTGELALTIAAVFTGAAIYVNIAEQPARLQLDNRSLLAEWKPAYKRGHVMQASLAIVGGLFGLLAYLTTLDWRWLLGAVQKSEQTGTGFRSKAAGDFGGKRHLISLQSDTRFRRFRHP